MRRLFAMHLIAGLLAARLPFLHTHDHAGTHSRNAHRNSVALHAHLPIHDETGSGFGLARTRDDDSDARYSTFLNAQAPEAKNSVTVLEESAVLPIAVHLLHYSETLVIRVHSPPAYTPLIPRAPPLSFPA